MYLAGGKLAVQGAAHEAVQTADLAMLQAPGPGIDSVVRKLRHLPRVETAAVFGDAVQIAGRDRSGIRAAVDALPENGLAWEECHRGWTMSSSTC